MEIRKYGRALASFAEKCFIKIQKARWTDRKEVENPFKGQEEKMSCPFLAESV